MIIKKHLSILVICLLASSCSTTPKPLHSKYKPKAQIAKGVSNKQQPKKDKTERTNQQRSNTTSKQLKPQNIEIAKSQLSKKTENNKYITKPNIRKVNQEELSGIKWDPQYEKNIDKWLVEYESKLKIANKIEAQENKINELEREVRYQKYIANKSKRLRERTSTLIIQKTAILTVKDSY